MKIGIIKETQKGENRIALVPEAAAALVQAGATLILEAGAGAGAGFPNQDFERAGARIDPSAAAVLQEADLVLKVKGPTADEFSAFREGQALFCFLVARNRPKLVDFLLARRMTALAFEAVKTNDGRFPLLAPMSVIAGRQAVWIGRDLLAGIDMKRLVVLGGGTAGTAAALQAADLDAMVDLFEIDAHRLDRLRSLLPADVVLHLMPDDGLADIVAEADLVINTAALPTHSPVHLVDRSTVNRMRPGRVIMDVSATIGGAVETVDRLTSHEDPVYSVEGILHYAVPNIPSLFAPAASEALSHGLLPYLMKLASEGIPAALERCKDLRRARICAKGVLTDPAVAQAQVRPWQESRMVFATDWTGS